MSVAWGKDVPVTILGSIGSFAVVAGIVTLIPGLDTALVLRAAVTNGRRHAFVTAIGINTGVLAWGAAAAVGVSAVLTASHLAYDVLRVAGATYMVWMGASMLWHSVRRRTQTAPDGMTGQPQVEPTRVSLRRSWSRGFTTNLLNPKVGVFYMALLPQFIPENAPHLLMGLTLAVVHDIEGFAWLTALTLGVHAVGRWLRSTAVQRAMDRITGTALIGFGISLALSDN